MSKGTQIHQLIPVETDMSAKISTLLLEADRLWGHPDQFTENDKTLKMFDDNRKQEEPAGREFSAMTTTVKDKLNYLRGPMTELFDVKTTLERSNQVATASVMLDDKVFLEDVPVGGLLGLKTQLNRLRQNLSKIPTLPPGHKWERQEDGTYADSEPATSNKSEKMLVHEIVAPATNQHKAQVHIDNVSRPVGIYTQRIRSGMISSYQKSKMLDSLDTMIGAVKDAQMRANCAEIKQCKVGSKIFDKLLEALD